ncbi:uncharacterized protein LOC144122829 [Amblyomma americanum]
MTSSSDLSGDSVSPGEARSIELRSPRTGGLTSPVQIIVDRAYHVQDRNALPLFAGGATGLFILLAIVFYVVLRSDGSSGVTRQRNRLLGPILSCYYDPAWSNATRRGAYVYSLAQHFHAEICTHAVLVGVQYSYHGILVRRYVSESLPNFLNLKRPGLSLVVSVLVPDVSKASADPGHFAATVAGWAIERGLDGVELDLAESASGKGYDVLVEAVSAELARSPQIWILSANIYMRPSFINQVDLNLLHRHADILILNTQQLSNDDHVTAAHSPLYGKDSWNHSLGEVYARTGTLSRLMPVVPFVSREFELRPERGAPRVAAGTACRGLAPRTQYHSAPGTRAFFEVCRTLEDSSWFKAWQEDEYQYMMAKELQFLVVESKESVICKMRFAKIHGLLGVALKELGFDAFRVPSECGTQEALFDAVAMEMRYMDPRKEEKLDWKLADRRLTVVYGTGTITCSDTTG